MDKINIKNARSLPPRDNERPPKRRRADTSNSSDLNTSGNDTLLKTWDSESIRGEFEVIRRQLSRTEAIAIQCHEMRMKTEESNIEQKRKQLEMQIPLDKGTTAQLKKELERSIKEMEEAREETQKARREVEESRKETQNARREVEEARKEMQEARRETQQAKTAQKVVEVKLSQLMTQLGPIIGRITEITPLIMDSRSEGTSKGSQSQKQTDVGNNLGKVLTPQKDLNPENIQFKEARIIIQTPGRPTHEQRQNLEAEVEHNDELEEEEQVERSGISSSHEPGKKTALSGGDSGDSSLIASDNDDTSLNQGNDEVGDTSEASDEKSHLSDSQSVIPENEQQQQNDMSMLVTGNYSVTVDRKFLELKWNQELERIQGNWVCRTCTKTTRYRENIQDHVWKMHYGGKFKCTYCTHPPKYFFTRNSFKKHCTNHHTLC